MRFNSGLISCLLLASAVLGDSDQSQLLNLLGRSPINNKNWVGSRQTNFPGTYDSITGILVAPQLSGDPGSAVAVWMGIDGDADRPGIPHSFISGILSTVTSNGIQHQAFMRWYPHPPLDFPFDIVTGDRVKITFNVSDWMSGSLTFENLSRTQSVTKDFQCSAALSGAYAEWMVGYVSSYGANVPLANFSRILISDASAGARDGAFYGPNAQGAGNIFLFEMTTDNGVMFKPVVDGDSLTVET